MARECPAPGSRAEAADWDARQWLIDNDFWHDTVGMSPKMCHRAVDARTQTPMRITIKIRSPTPCCRSRW